MNYYKVKYAENQVQGVVKTSGTVYGGYPSRHKAIWFEIERCQHFININEKQFNYLIKSSHPSLDLLSTMKWNLADIRKYIERIKKLTKL